MTLPKGFYVGEKPKRDSKGYLFILVGIMLIAFSIGYFFYTAIQNILEGNLYLDPWPDYLIMILPIPGTILGFYAIIDGWYRVKK